MFMDTRGLHRRQLYSDLLYIVMGTWFAFIIFPVWPVYSIDVCLDWLPSIPQNLCTFGDF